MESVNQDGANTLICNGFGFNLDKFADYCIQNSGLQDLANPEKVTYSKIGTNKIVIIVEGKGRINIIYDNDVIIAKIVRF